MPEVSSNYLFAYTALLCLGFFVGDLLNGNELAKKKETGRDEDQHHHQHSMQNPNDKPNDGYKKTFEQYAYAIRDQYPDLSIKLDGYPVPALRLYIAQGLTALKFFFIICIAFGRNPFEWLAVATPSFYFWALQNKIYACLMLFFMTGLVEGQLTSTGAFEIYYNDIPIWSKLESGRIPSFGELMEILNANMQLGQDSLKNKH